MIWKNLRINKCPKCNSDLADLPFISTVGEHFAICENTGSCGFMIRQEKLDKIISDLKPKTKIVDEVENNLSGLSEL